MAGEDSAASANIPAWKKLGLKLKYAKDPIEEEIEANKGKGKGKDKSSSKDAAAEAENADPTDESFFLHLPEFANRRQHLPVTLSSQIPGIVRP